MTPQHVYKYGTQYIWPKGPHQAGARMWEEVTIPNYNNGNKLFNHYQKAATKIIIIMGDNRPLVLASKVGFGGPIPR